MGDRNDPVLVTPDGVALQETAEALEIADQSGDDFILANARLTRGGMLVERDGAESRHGFDLLAMVRQAALRQRFNISALWVHDIQIANEMLRSGDTDHAIELSRAVIDDLLDARNMIWGGVATTTLVESLLRRGADGDLQDAQAAIERLAAVPTDPGFVLHDLPLLRLLALLAHAHGDEAIYRISLDRYRARAEECGFEGHMAAADSMTDAARR